MGHIATSLIFIGTVLTGFKYLSTTDQSSKKQMLIFMGIGTLPIAMFIGFIYLNKAISTPTIHFGDTGSLIIGVIAALFIIGLSIWTKSWAVIIIIALLTLPDYLLKLTTLQYETQLIISTIITFGGIAIYIWLSSKLEKSE